MVAETVDRHGRLDVLVNCAGVWVEGPTAEMTEEQWDRTIDVNLKGTFFACRFAIPHLERTRGLHRQPFVRRRSRRHGRDRDLQRVEGRRLAPHEVARARAGAEGRPRERRLPERRRHADARGPGARLRWRRSRGVPRRAGRELPTEGPRAIHPARGDRRADRLPRIGSRPPPSPARASRSTSAAPPAIDGAQQDWLSSVRALTGERSPPCCSSRTPDPSRCPPT